MTSATSILKRSVYVCSLLILLIGGYLFVLPNVGNIYSYNFNWFSENSISIVFAQTSASTMDNMNKTKLVYHLSSDEPWRATIALLDSQTMLKMGYNVTLMLSIEGVQLGVKNPHQYLGLQPLIKNVSDFISKGGQVIICETCLKIAGYDNTDIINGSIIGDPKIMANLLNQTTVVGY